MVQPAAARAAAHREALDTHRVSVLEDLGVGHAGVGHVRVHGARPLEARAGPGAAGDRLVVAEAPVAEQDVVHGSLAAGREPQGLEERVDEPLARLDVAADDRRRQARVGIEHRIEQTARDGQIDGAHQPLVERQRPAQQEAQDVHDGAADDRRCGVEVPRMHRRRAGKIDAGVIAVEGHGDAQDRPVVEPLLGLVTPWGDAPQCAADTLFGERPERLHVARHGGRAVLRRERAQCQGSGVVRRRHRPQVGEIVLDGARRVRRRLEKLSHIVPEGLAVPHQETRRYHDPLLGECRRRGGHRAGAAAARRSARSLPRTPG